MQNEVTHKCKGKSKIERRKQGRCNLALSTNLAIKNKINQKEQKEKD